MITSLKPHEVIVVGTNIKGQHGAGAAAYAHEHFDLAWGVGEGLSGQTYALPTMEGKPAFQAAVDRFVQYAAKHPELTFQLTPVGCGIAGYDRKQVRHMIGEIPSNVVFVEEWKNVMREGGEL